MMRLVFGVLSAAALILSAEAARAVAITSTIYEPFTTAGTLNGSTSGTGFTGAWGTVATFLDGSITNAGSLAYGALSTSGNAANLVSVSATGAADQRSLGDTFDAGELFFSYLVRKNANTTRSTGFYLMEGTNDKLYVGQLANPGVAGSGPFSVRANNGAAGNVGTAVQTMTTGETFLVVGRINFNASGTNEQIRIYINPTLGADIDTLTPAVNSSSHNLGGVNAVRLFTGDGASPAVLNVHYDEIRLGPSYASVTPVPEPSTICLLAVGSVLAAASIRARRRHG